MTVYVMEFFQVAAFLVLCNMFLEIFARKAPQGKAVTCVLWAEAVFGDVLIVSAGTGSFVLKFIAVLLVTSFVMWAMFGQSYRKILLLVFVYQTGVAVIGCLAGVLVGVSVDSVLWGQGEPVVPGVFLIQEMLVFCLILVIKKMRPESASYSLSNREWACFFIFPLFTVVAVAEAYLYFDENEPRQQNVLFGIAMGLCVMDLVIYHLMDDVARGEKQTAQERVFWEEMKNQTQNYQRISDNYEKQRKRIHEFRNQMSCILALAKQGNFEKLQSYLEGMQFQIQSETDCIDTNHALVNAILNAKYQEARRQGITFVVKINDLSGIRLADKDIVVILYNLLNNAFEACGNCAEKVVRLKLTRECGEILLAVQNTCERAPRQRGGRFLTSKAEVEEHGLGIENVKETVEKYGGEYSIKYEEGIFRFVIVIPEGLQEADG